MSLKSELQKLRDKIAWEGEGYALFEYFDPGSFKDRELSAAIETLQDARQALYDLGNREGVDLANPEDGEEEE